MLLQAGFDLFLSLPTREKAVYSYSSIISSSESSAYLPHNIELGTIHSLLFYERAHSHKNNEIKLGGPLLKKR